jgi:hypothetical protein
MISLVLTGCSSAAAITGVAVSGVAREAATIEWTTSGNATSQVEYGTTSAMTSETTVTTTSVTDHSVDLADLTAGTTYYYRAVSGAAVSDGGSFTTLGTPSIYNVSASAADVSATVTWATTSNADSQVEYGTSTSYGSTTTLSATLTSSHSETVTGLTAGTTYHYRVLSSGGVSADGTFSTSASLAAITALWESSDHNNRDFLINTGTNTYCTRCHAPEFWDPLAIGNGGKVSGAFPMYACFNCKGPGADADGWNSKSLASEAMGGVVDRGEATGGTATSLIDTEQDDFETTVTVGQIVSNVTGSSYATVTAIVSDTELTLTALVADSAAEEEGEARITWEAGDRYHIYTLASDDQFDMNIGCTTCHDGGAGPDIAMWNNGTMGYDAVATTSELCSKCHGYARGGYGAITSAASGGQSDSGTADAGGDATTLIDAGQDFETTVEVGFIIFNETDNSLGTVTVIVDDETLTTSALVGRSGVVDSSEDWVEGDKYNIIDGPIIAGGAFDGTDHSIILAGGAHANEIGIAAADRGPYYCTDCHDPHSGAAKDCTDCHTTLPVIAASASIHSSVMAKVNCMACHTGEDGDMGWVDLDEDEVLGSAGDIFNLDSTSHFINREAKNCQSCHYVTGDVKSAGSRGAPDVLWEEDNPYGLDHEDNA